MPQAVGSSSITESSLPSPEALLDLLKWHLDRYDRLRASTTSRASVVLSAGAILTTGDAVVFAQLLARAGSHFDGWVRATLGSGLMVSAILVVGVLIRASGVLVTLKHSQALFPTQDELPPALLFNGPATLSEAATFSQFRAAIQVQDYGMMIDAAQVELWYVIQQHRYRYSRLRSAVRILSVSALIFLFSFVALLSALTIGT